MIMPVGYLRFTRSEASVGFKGYNSTSSDTDDRFQQLDLSLRVNLGDKQWIMMRGSITFLTHSGVCNRVYNFL